MCKIVDNPNVFRFSQYMQQARVHLDFSCCSKCNNVLKFPQISGCFFELFPYIFSSCWSIMCGETDESRPLLCLVFSS